MSSTDIAVLDQSREIIIDSENMKQFVTMRLDGQLFGIDVHYVQDVLRPQKIAPVPHSPSEIAGMINLRGIIVTVINMRKKLGLSEFKNEKKTMQIVLDFAGNLYSLIVDSVGEVLTLSDEDFEHVPPNLASAWQTIASGVYRLEQELMVVLDVNALLPAAQLNENEE